MTATKSQRKSAPPAVTLHAAPLADCTLCPGGRDGVLTIGDDVYKVAYLEANGNIVGYSLTKTCSGDSYSLPADLSSCECRGWLRHQHCKHLHALRCVKATGRVA